MAIPDSVYNVVGFMGAGLILLGFYRISIGRWTNKSIWYELDNMAGATFLIIYQLHLHAFISVVLNTIWVIVAFHGLTSFAGRYSRSARRQVRRRKR